MVAPCCATEDKMKLDQEPACFTVRHDDSSRKVTTVDVEYSAPCAGAELGVHRDVERSSGRDSDTRTTSTEALRLAIKLAVDEGEYDRAAALLEVAKTTAPKTNASPQPRCGDG